MTWKAALSYCEGLTHAGSSDWRLPDVNELESLVDDSQTSPPVINTNAFPLLRSFVIDVEGEKIKVFPYWSSTTYALSSTGAWYVYFGGGGVSSATARPAATMSVASVKESWFLGSLVLWYFGTLVLGGANAPFLQGLTPLNFFYPPSPWLSRGNQVILGTK